MHLSLRDFFVSIFGICAALLPRAQFNFTFIHASTLFYLGERISRREFILGNQAEKLIRHIIVDFAF